MSNRSFWPQARRWVSGQSKGKWQKQDKCHPISFLSFSGKNDEWTLVNVLGNWRFSMVLAELRLRSKSARICAMLKLLARARDKKSLRFQWNFAVGLNEWRVQEDFLSMISNSIFILSNRRRPACEWPTNKSIFELCGHLNLWTSRLDRTLRSSCLK